MKVTVIFGGRSAEHDISVMSAFSIKQSLLAEGYEVTLVYINRSGDWIRANDQASDYQDKESLYFENGLSGNLINPGQVQEEGAVIFPVLHGPNGEDGTVQGLFESLNMPYVGCGVLASAVAMDKITSKQVFQSVGLPQVPYVAFIRPDWQADPDFLIKEIEAKLHYPMFIKPANMGSSVGISRADNKSDLRDGIEEALKYDRRILVEQGLDAREIEIGVIGYNEIFTSYPGEIGKTAGFYDFDEKYVNNSIEMLVPAPIEEAISERIRDYAKIAFKALDGSGLARCDFFLTSDNQIYINEVNTLPGFTPFSMFSYMWEKTGISYGELLTELIRLANDRYDDRKN